MRGLIAAALVLALSGVAAAEDKKDAKKSAKPTGTWVRGDGDNKITFAFNGDKVTVTVTMNGNEIKAEADIGMTADKVVFGYMTKVEPAADQGPQAGDLFAFKLEIKGDT